MHSLRNARRLARLVLAWFALTLFSAAAAPMVQPPGGEWVCSGGVMKLLSKAGGENTGPPFPDCPLCLAQDASSPGNDGAMVMPQPQGHAVQLLAAARIAALTAPPLPARGPPDPLSIQ